MKARFLRVIASYLFVLFAGCSGADSATTASTSEALFKGNFFGWDRDPNGVTTTVPICWDERTYANGPAEPLLSMVKEQVRSAIEQTWQRESGLVFSGWGDCHSGGAGVFGIDLQVVSSGRGWTNIIHAPWEPKHADVQINWTGAVRYEAIHEIGHALGFNHEQARPDNNGRCNTIEASDFATNFWGGMLETPWDDRSIMNYCAGGPTELSPLDIMGLQKVYGRKPGLNLVSSRGECVSGPSVAVTLQSCVDGNVQGGFNPAGDSIRLATGTAVAPATNGWGSLTTTGTVNPNWDRYKLTNVTVRGLAGKKLNVYGAGTSPGTPVCTWEDGTIPWAANVFANELWTFTPDGSIHGYGGQCLDVQGANPATGTPVSMSPCHGGPNQNWRLSWGDEIVSALGDAVGIRKCLEVDRDDTDLTTPFAQIQLVHIADCNGSLRQKWSIRGPLTSMDGLGCVSAAGAEGSSVQQLGCDGSVGQTLDMHW